ncbi:MAG: DUF1580 domain-containing protein [Phycisphaeraceae bacterium]|nr:DUF1580 domain-containing protein [Phycisphaeraceae bacterium]
MKQQDSTGMANGANPGAPAAEEHITLSQAAKLAPGRPSSNCVWRWCREGVKAASGTRVRLKHVRFGSRIYTTRQWLNDFGLALAEADAAHFDRDEQSPAPEPSRRTSKRSRRASRSSGADEARRRHLDAERELEEAGL